MKNHYKRISRRLILSILILISCVFLTSLCVAPEEGREPVPEASAGPATPEMPQEPELLEKIEALRCYFGRPVIITSGVRCEARNEEVGGVSWSFHKRGCAADLYCPGVGVGDLAAGAKDCGLNILPYYSSGYIHVEIIP